MQNPSESLSLPPDHSLVTSSRLPKRVRIAAACLSLLPLAGCDIWPQGSPPHETQAATTPTPRMPETRATSIPSTPHPETSPSPTPTQETHHPSEIEENCAFLAANEVATSALRQVLVKYLDDKFIKGHQAPGGVIVVGCGEETIASVTFGNKTYEKKNPVTLETKYDVASVTKLFTTMGILMLHEQGVLDIDEPIHTTLPEYAKGLKATITLRQLLQHKAGIIDGKYSQILNGSSEPAQIEENLLDWPVEKDQVNKYNYSNVGFSVAGIAASKQLGRPLTEAIEELIFEPLGMKNTTYTPAQNCAPTTSDYDSTVYNCDLQDRLGRPLQGDSYHTGVFTTGEDIAIFMQEVSKALMNKSPMISREIISTMCTPSSPGYGTGARINDIVTSNGIKTNFGRLSNEACGHTGWNGTQIAWDPQSGLSIGFLSNGTYDQHMENRYADFSSIRRGANNRVIEVFATINP